MVPLTLFASNKFRNLLTANDALSQAISVNAASVGVDAPVMNAQQILNSYASPDMGDLNLQLTYPRICVYTSQVSNNQREKFRAFSGTTTVIADIWSSADLEQPAEAALHVFVGALTNILAANLGDWGDGFRYSGTYSVQIHTPKLGGLGFVQLGRVSCDLHVTF